MEEKIIKYPRTRHIEGSRLQKGDEDLSQIPFSKIKGKYLVIEEKVDGANVAISFSDKNELLLQSRGHFLKGGYRERHYNLFKMWANNYQEEFFKILGNRYIMYGEWLYAKHSIYYDALPHYFLEFDVYDKKEKIFLDTKNRQDLLKDSPVISVPVLKTGKFNNIKEILKYLSNSNYISENHLNNLKDEVLRLNLDIDKVLNETDSSLLMEGLYIKVEENGKVVERMKYVRPGFKQDIIESTINWLERPIITNKLSKDFKDIF